MLRRVLQRSQERSAIPHLASLRVQPARRWEASTRGGPDAPARRYEHNYANLLDSQSSAEFAVNRSSSSVKYLYWLLRGKCGMKCLMTDVGPFAGTSSRTC